MTTTATNTAAGTETLRVIPCQVGPYRVAIELRAVHSLHASEPVVPHADGTPLVGYLPSRTGALPIYSLAELLGQERAIGHSADAAARAVLFHGVSQSWGLLVDRVYPAVDIPAGRLAPLPEAFRESAAGFSCVLERDGEWLPLLAPHRIDPDGGYANADDGWAAGRAERNGAEFRSALPPAVSQFGRLIVVRGRDDGADRRPVCLGLAAADVREVRDYAAVSGILGSPDYLLGLASWRGAAIPVIDPAKRLGLASEDVAEGGRSRLVILQRGDRLAALRVRGDIRVVRLPAPHAASARELHIDSEFVHSVVELRDATVVLPKLDALLA